MAVVTIGKARTQVLLIEGLSNAELRGCSTSSGVVVRESQVRLPNGPEGGPQAPTASAPHWSFLPPYHPEVRAKRPLMAVVTRAAGTSIATMAGGLSATAESTAAALEALGRKATEKFLTSPEALDHLLEPRPWPRRPACTATSASSGV